MPQLIHWPFVQVSFKSEDLHFVRGVNPTYTRFLQLNGQEFHQTNAGSTVESINCLATESRCFTFNLIQAYVQEYLRVIRPNISMNLHGEISTILNHFLSDIKDIDINDSIATGLILFKLCPYTYGTLKKYKNDDQSTAVGYCELMQPRIELCFCYFRGEQRNTPEISFVSTENIKETTKTNISANEYKLFIPAIEYLCTFCRVRYTGSNSKIKMLRHLYIEHKMESCMRCQTCKLAFDVLTLAENRWRHVCECPQND